MQEVLGHGEVWRAGALVGGEGELGERVEGLADHVGHERRDATRDDRGEEGGEEEAEHVSPGE